MCYENKLVEMWKSVIKRRLHLRLSRFEYWKLTSVSKSGYNEIYIQIPTTDSLGSWVRLWIEAYAVSYTPFS